MENKLINVKNRLLEILKQNKEKQEDLIAKIYRAITFDIMVGEKEEAKILGDEHLRVYNENNAILDCIETIDLDITNGTTNYEEKLINLKIVRRLNRIAELTQRRKEVSIFEAKKIDEQVESLDKEILELRGKLR